MGGVCGTINWSIGSLGVAVNTSFQILLNTEIQPHDAGCLPTLGGRQRLGRAAAEAASLFSSEWGEAPSSCVTIVLALGHFHVGLIMGRTFWIDVRGEESFATLVGIASSAPFALCLEPLFAGSWSERREQ